MESYLKDEFGFDAIGWCNYCHSEIYLTDDYIVEGGSMFHRECYDQSHTYIDQDFLDEENYE